MKRFELTSYTEFSKVGDDDFNIKYLGAAILASPLHRTTDFSIAFAAIKK